MTLQDRFLMFASKVGSQKHLAAIRDSFAMVMPLIIAGSLAVLLNNLHQIFQMEKTFLPAFLVTLNGNVWWGTFAMLTIFIVLLIGYNLAKSYDSNPVAASIVALGSFLAITPQLHTVTVGEGAEAVTGAVWGFINWNHTQATGLFVGMIISLIATEIFVRLSRNKALTIKMPDGVPPAVARSFAALIPGIVTLYALTLLVFLIEKGYSAMFLAGQDPMNVFDIVNKVVAAPLTNLADNYFAALIVAFFNHILWFFGLHGSNILEGILQPIYTPLLMANTEAYKNGLTIPHVVTKQMFDTYVYMGGSGCTLGLIIATFIASKNKARRSIAALGAAPGLFNINEPVIFGMPIVLNPLFAIPFILTPFVLTTTTYWALKLGLAGRIIGMAPWSTPPILSAIITTNHPLSAVILQLINLALGILIYIPFVIMADRNDRKLEQAKA